MSKAFKLISAIIVASAFAGAANADTLAYNTALANGVYFGSGNPNAGYTTNTRSDGLELGLGVSLRSSGAVVPSPTNSSIYYVPTGYDHVQPNVNRAAWNFNFSVDTPIGFVLGTDHWGLTILNVGNSQTFSFDPSAIPDNATNGSGGFQNSENLVFYTAALGYDMNAVDSYVVTLSLLDAAGASVFGVSETINATPIPGALPLFVSGLGVIGFVARRRKRKPAAALATV